MTLATVTCALPSGGSAQVLTQITYGLRRRVQAALVHHRQRADLELRLRAEAELIVGMVASWTLTDPAGQPLPLTVDGIDLAPAADVDALFSACVRLFSEGTADPPKGLPRSPDSLEA